MKKNFKKNLLYIIFVIICLCPNLTYADDIVDQLKSDINYLCSPELAGRDVPGVYGDKVALWVADRFDKSGLQPAMADTGYIQQVPFVQAKLNTVWSNDYPEPIQLTFFGPNLNEVGSDWEATFCWGNNFYIFPRRIAPLDTTFKVAWCGYGIVDKASGRNDFTGAAGKAAMVLPGSDLPPGKAGHRALIPFKVAAAERAGARMLIVLDTKQEYVSDSKAREKTGFSSKLIEKINTAGNPLIDLPGSAPDFPTVYFYDSKLLHSITTYNYIENIEQYIESAAQFGGLRASLRVTYKNYVNTHGYNVVAKLDGAIPEYVIIGAHYDHLGIVLESKDNVESAIESYYPGADDNASGVAGLLEICRRWVNRDRTGRGLIAVSFTAEEDGRLGSQWFMNHLPVPRESIVAMVNMDEIGRCGFSSMRYVHQKDAVPDPEYAAAYYSATSPELKDILVKSVSGVDLDLNIQPVNSFSHFGDAGSFHDKQIPTVNLFSGFHSDYHSPRDTPDKIDYEKMSRMIDLADQLLVNLSQVSDRIGFDPSNRVKSVIPH